MSSQQGLAATARAVIDSNSYLTLGTTGGDGLPWVSPVYYAATGYTEFYWASSPRAAHSRNLARHPQVSMVVFDSRAAPGKGQAVYMTALAVELAGADIDRGIGIYPRPAERGEHALTAGELRPPAAYRLYRATVSQHWILCPRDSGQPCSIHGHTFDHRTPVTV